MKSLKKGLLGLVVFVLAMSVISQFLPDQYRVERKILIAAKPPSIFPWINQLKKWPEWSAWTPAKDPSLVYAYEGPAEGVGAISKWDAKKLGQGTMKITQADPSKGITFDLSFEHGRYLSVGTLTFQASGESTEVIWGMDGKVNRNPMDRWFSLLMDRLVSPDLEEGLRNLKGRAESK